MTKRLISILFYLLTAVLICTLLIYFLHAIKIALFGAALVVAGMLFLWSRFTPDNKNDRF